MKYIGQQLIKETLNEATWRGSLSDTWQVLSLQKEVLSMFRLALGGRLLCHFLVPGVGSATNHQWEHTFQHKVPAKLCLATLLAVKEEGTLQS